MRRDGSVFPGRLFAAHGRLRWGRASCLLVCCAAWAQEAEQDDRVRTLRQVDVMSQTPLPGVNQRLDRYPGHVQLADDSDIERAQNGNLPEFMNRQPPRAGKAGRLLGGLCQGQLVSRFALAGLSAHQQGSGQAVRQLRGRQYRSVSRGRAVQPGEDLESARFVAPGTPRSVVVGVRYEWD